MSHTEDYYLRLHISLLLRAAGIPPHMLGYRYLCEALLLSVKNNDLLLAVTKELYPEVAKNNQTTISCIEHSIRHAISVAYKKQLTPLATVLFAYNKPTNSEFIAVLSNYLHVKCMGYLDLIP